MNRKLLLLVMIPSLSFLALGCGSSNSGGGGANQPLSAKGTLPVTGFLKYKGSPVKDALVSFVPFEESKALAARGRTDGIGSFKLSTYGKDDGAPPGKYKVLAVVEFVKESEPGVLEPIPEGWKSPIPTKYGNAKSTDIWVEVKEGDKNEFTIELK